MARDFTIQPKRSCRDRALPPLPRTGDGRSRPEEHEGLAWNRLAIRGSGCSTVPADYVAACRSAVEGEDGSYLPLDLMGDVIDQQRADGAEGPRVQGEEFSNALLASPYLVRRHSVNVLGGHREPVDLGPDQYPTKGTRAFALYLIEMQRGELPLDNASAKSFEVSSFHTTKPLAPSERSPRNLAARSEEPLSLARTVQHFGRGDGQSTNLASAMLEGVAGGPGKRTSVGLQPKVPRRGEALRSSFDSRRGEPSEKFGTERFGFPQQLSWAGSVLTVQFALDRAHASGP